MSHYDLDILCTTLTLNVTMHFLSDVLFLFKHFCLVFILCSPVLATGVLLFLSVLEKKNPHRLLIVSLVHSFIHSSLTAAGLKSLQRNTLSHFCCVVVASPAIYITYIR